MWGYEAVSIPRQTLSMLLSWALLALPALAGESAPPPQSDDPAIAAALRYQHGDGAARNPGRAAEMLCAAAHGGNADAAYRLGWMYAHGDGIARDAGHAVALLQHAAALGHRAALQMLEGMPGREGRLPLCLTLAPPPVIAAAGDADSEPPAQEKPEAIRTTRTAPAANPRPASAAVPAATAPAPAVASPVSDQIAFAIAHWADAWSRRDVDRYLAAYAPDFQLRPGESRQQWERQRRVRITQKTWIEIRIRDLAIDVEGSLARARFVQSYRSSTGHESAMKTLTLVKPGKHWLIRQEQSEALRPATRAR